MLLAKALQAEPLVVGAVGLAAFLGHLFPVFFGFRGGKGVATALGVMGGFGWPVGLGVLSTWLAVAVVSRLSSLAALVTAVMAPAYVWWWLRSETLTATTALMAALLVWRHRPNIARLLRGEESRIGQRPD